MVTARLTAKEIVKICTTHCGNEIAAQCGVAKSATCTRHNPTALKEKGAKRHRGMCEMRRSAYVAAQSARSRKLQQQSLVHVTRFNAPYLPNEEAYLRDNAKRQTAIEIAIALGRTYFSVRGFASSRNIDMRKS